MNRRNLLKGLVAGGLWNILPGLASAAAPVRDMKGIQELQKNWMALLAAGVSPPMASETLNLSKDEWRKRLDKMQFHVLRNEGTERAGTSPLNQEKREGIFVCAGCDLPVFSSAMKYESGTGWPSFFTTIPGAFATKTDYVLFLPRTEYHCNRCGGHHGHVFDDGPPPTGQRWCNNGAALKFIPKSGKA